MSYRDKIKKVKSKYTKQKPEIPLKDDPVAFAEKYLRILNKEKQNVPLLYNLAQKKYLANRTHRDLILKARQLGFSTAIDADNFRLAITRTETIAILAHEDETTQKLRRMVDRFYENFPAEYKPVRKYANSRLASYPVTDSEIIIATAGNKNTGRGGTYSRVHGSEVAFFKDAEAIMAGILQGGNPSIALESTPNGAQGYFYELCMEALEHKGVWRLHFFPWFEDPSYRLPLEQDEIIVFTEEELALVAREGLTPEQIKWRRDKQKELKALFIQEYPEDPISCFLQSGYGYFGDTSKVFIDRIELNMQLHHRYVAGLDFGQVNDFTSMSIADATANIQVDLLHINKLSWEEMRRQIVHKCKYWRVEVLVAEKNSIGGPNIESLVAELRNAGCNTKVIAFDMSNESKTELAAEFYTGIHENNFKLLNAYVDGKPIQKQQLNNFVAKQLPSGKWKLAAATGHDDTVISNMLMYHAKHKNAPSVAIAGATGLYGR